MIIEKRIGRNTNFAGWGRFFHLSAVKNESGSRNGVSISLPLDLDTIRLSKIDAFHLRNFLNRFLED